ncbi:unnamed protein product, partial [Amoebophrya sp. A120]
CSNSNLSTSCTNANDPLPPLVPLSTEGVNPRAVQGIEACLHEYCQLFEQAQRGPVDDIPTYLEATARPWMTTYLESCIDHCPCCVEDHQLKIEKVALGARVCTFGKAIAPVDRNGNAVSGYTSVELSNAATDPRSPANKMGQLLRNATFEKRKLESSNSATDLVCPSSPDHLTRQDSAAAASHAFVQKSPKNLRRVSDTSAFNVPGMGFGNSPNGKGQASEANSPSNAAKLSASK